MRENQQQQGERSGGYTEAAGGWGKAGGCGGDCVKKITAAGEPGAICGRKAGRGIH